MRRTARAGATRFFAVTVYSPNGRYNRILPHQGIPLPWRKTAGILGNLATLAVRHVPTATLRRAWAAFTRTFAFYVWAVTVVHFQRAPPWAFRLSGLALVCSAFARCVKTAPENRMADKLHSLSCGGCDAILSTRLRWRRCGIQGYAATPPPHPLAGRGLATNSPGLVAPSANTKRSSAAFGLPGQ